MSLIVIDSRDRLNPSSTTPTDVVIPLETPINIRKATLIFVDIPIPEDGQAESCFFIRVQEFGTNVHSSKHTDKGSFVIMRDAEEGYRTLSYENANYTQTLDIGSHKMISELNISFHYRSGATSELTLVDDWSLIMRIE